MSTADMPRTAVQKPTFPIARTSPTLKAIAPETPAPLAATNNHATQIIPPRCRRDPFRDAPERRTPWVPLDDWYSNSKLIERS